MKKFILIFLTCCLTTVPICQAGVVYQPPEEMWDSWLLQDGDDYHLFFLVDGDIGRAVSQDLIHWKHLPMIKNLASEGDWDESGMHMTGCTAKHDGKYYLSYGSGEGRPIGLIVSDDLVNWKRVGDPVLPQKPPYQPGDWRDLSSYWNDEKQQWDGYLFGIHAKTQRSSIVYVTSKDYLNWTYHEPIFISDSYSRTNKGFVCLEVPDLFEMGGKHYIMFSSIQSRKQHTSGREDASGTWYLTADKREGPYHVPENPLLLGSGMGRHDHYVGRTVMYKGDRLVYHHNWGDQTVDWSTPKLLNKGKDDELFMTYWPALDCLKTKPLFNQKSITVATDKGFNFKEHVIKANAADFMLTCDIDLNDAKSLSIFWRVAKESNTYGLKIEPDTAAFSIVQLEKSLKYKANTYHTYVKDRYTNKNLCEQNINLRLMVRKGRSEIYINDRWIFNVGLKDISEKGAFVLLAEQGRANVKNLEISELQPLVLQK